MSVLSVSLQGRMAHNRRDLTGRRFGRLVVVRQNGKYLRKLRWDCICDCGCEINVIGCNLTNGGTSSCGCVGAEKTVARNKTMAKHGMGGTRTYDTWFSMIQRCSKPDDANYSARGITVCSWLKASPKNFRSLIGEKPETAKRRRLSVDRINTNGSYSCGNCEECKRNGWPMNLRWATQKQQMRNVRYNRMITIGDRTQCMAAWSEEAGLKNGVLAMRLKLGWAPERLLIPST